MSIAVSSRQIANRLLAALPREEHARLVPRLQRVRLHKGQVICEAGDRLRFVYFVNSGVLSLLSTTRNGETIEVAMVGSEGVTGIPVILGINRMPYGVMVRVQGDAMRMRAEVFRDEFARGGRFQRLLLGYTHTLFIQVAQSTVCNRFHPFEQRLARWLLLTRDEVKSNTFKLTQEFISQMLGTQRTLVTMAASALQDAGLIRYHYGQIKILDSPGLEAAACECYGIVKQEIEQISRP